MALTEIGGGSQEYFSGYVRHEVLAPTSLTTPTRIRYEHPQGQTMTSLIVPTEQQVVGVALITGDSPEDFDVVAASLTEDRPSRTIHWNARDGFATDKPGTPGDVVLRLANHGDEIFVRVFDRGNGGLCVAEDITPLIGPDERIGGLHLPTFRKALRAIQL